MSGLRHLLSLSPQPPEWISDYADSVTDPEALRVEVDTFMEAYDKKIAAVGAFQGTLYPWEGWAASI